MRLIMTEARTYKVTDKLKGEAKMARIRVDIEPTEKPLRKPDWIRIRIPATPAIANLKKNFRENRLHTVCEEASCPNLAECFNHGTATFMIMGDKCTRRCTFCDVGHGRPDPLDLEEPKNLAQTVKDMQLKYVVITSVDRDDLRDGGAEHYANCIREIRSLTPHIKIEVLVPDFRGRMEKALAALNEHIPDVFNHNVETTPRLYKAARPGADYEWSLRLLQEFKQAHPHVPTKSGIMVGLGETDEEVEAVMADLRAHDVDMMTIGQYLQPSKFHIPVRRYVHPDQFKRYKEIGEKMGFDNVASGPMVRSSYHADLQAAGEIVG